MFDKGGDAVFAARYDRAMLETRTPMKIALVTGAARRIGATLAERLAQRDYAVVVHTSARSQNEACALVQRLRDGGTRASFVVADLAQADEAEGLIDTAAAAFGPVTLLVNNASLFEADDIATLDAALFDRQVAINLRAPLLLAKRFAAQANADDDSSIVNILDQRVLAPNPLYLSYTLSKAGFATATAILAQALAPNVRVNAVAPGPVLPNAHEGLARFEAEVAQVPLARPVPPAAIADAVEYLAGARTVTGQIIAVDSGQRLAWRTPDVLASMGA